jgi:hypothetical protein
MTTPPLHDVTQQQYTDVFTSSVVSFPVVRMSAYSPRAGFRSSVTFGRKIDRMDRINRIGGD